MNASQLEITYFRKRQFQNFALLEDCIDVWPLLVELNEKPDLWNEITERQTYQGSAHKDTESVFLRWCEEKTLDAGFNSIPACDYPALDKLPSALPLIKSVLRAAESDELGRVLIVKLKPGGAITRHTDEGKYADHYERFHIPLYSGDGNLFCVERDEECGEHVHMKAGELWWFNHKAPHFVVNNSEFPRVHLIVDCVSKQYRRHRWDT